MLTNSEQLRIQVLNGRPVEAQDLQLATVPDYWGFDTGCRRFCETGGLNRILFNDIASVTGGSDCNGSANLGPASLRDANIDHCPRDEYGWKGWPRSFAELAWEPLLDGEFEQPTPISPGWTLCHVSWESPSRAGISTCRLPLPLIATLPDALPRSTTAPWTVIEG